MDLPDELLLSIACHLPVYDCLVLSRTCNRWLLISKDAFLWKHFHARSMLNHTAALLNSFLDENDVIVAAEKKRVAVNVDCWQRYRISGGSPIRPPSISSIDEWLYRVYAQKVRYRKTTTECYALVRKTESYPLHDGYYGYGNVPVPFHQTIPGPSIAWGGTKLIHHTAGEWYMGRPHGYVVQVFVVPTCMRIKVNRSNEIIVSKKTGDSRYVYDVQYRDFTVEEKEAQKNGACQLIVHFEGTFWHGEKLCGIATYGDGSMYKGTWRDDHLSGYGVRYRSDGSIEYRGQWAVDQRWGCGEYHASDGSLYIGQWKKNKKHGQGTLTYANGDIYEGDWYDDYRWGMGVHRWSNGIAEYRGQWNRDQRFNKGTMKYADGSVYEGGWHDDCRSGSGIYRWSDGITEYRGEWHRDKRWGQGQYRTSDGTLYTGQWEKDKKHGTGVMTFTDGRVLDGIWVDGHPK